MIVFIVNATPMVRHNYRLGVPRSGFYREIINTDAETYGGGNVGNLGGVQSEGVHWMGREQSILIQLAAAGDAGVQVRALTVDKKSVDRL